MAHFLERGAGEGWACEVGGVGDKSCCVGILWNRVVELLLDYPPSQGLMKVDIYWAEPLQADALQFRVNWTSV